MKISGWSGKTSNWSGGVYRTQGRIYSNGEEESYKNESLVSLKKTSSKYQQEMSYWLCVDISGHKGTESNTNIPFKYADTLEWHLCGRKILNSYFLHS